jgi:NADPH:quinone reductase-like Zn-dependent oxidoreductase
VRAIVLTEHGGPDVIQYEEVPRPEPGSGEVLVHLRASALNRLDLWVREGWPGLNLRFPHILGADGAGDVAGLGENVRDFSIGDRVVIDANIGCGACGACLAGNDNLCEDWNLLGETIAGTLAEYISVPARNLLAIPDTIDYGHAAAASLIFLTAWHSLITRGNLQAGESVLVVGASGGVNTASIQIAKFAGATVYVVGSNTQKLALAESLGADTLIDRSKEARWDKAIWLATNQRGVDVIVNNVGAGTMPLSLRAAAKGGRILTVGNTGNPIYEIDHRYLFAKHLSIIGSTMSPIEDFRTVMGLIFRGKLKVVIDRRYPLQATADALQRLEAGEQLGKIVIDIPA